MAEVGVSTSMAAGAFTACMGGKPASLLLLQMQQENLLIVFCHAKVHPLRSLKLQKSLSNTP
jgi:hypothetical protein